MLPKAIVLNELTDNLTGLIPVLDDFTDIEIFQPKLALEEMVVGKIGDIVGDLKLLDEEMISMYLEKFPNIDTSGDFLPMVSGVPAKFPVKKTAVEELINEIDTLIWQIIPEIEEQATELKLALDQLLMEGVGVSVSQLLDKNPFKNPEGLKQEEGILVPSDVKAAKYDLIKLPKQITTLKARNLIIKTVNTIFDKIGKIEFKFITLGEIVVNGEFDDLLLFFKEVDPMDVIQKLEAEVMDIIDDIVFSFEQVYGEITSAIIDLEEAVLSKLGIEIGVFNTAVEEVKLFFKYVTKVLPKGIKASIPYNKLLTMEEGD